MYIVNIALSRKVPQIYIYWIIRMYIVSLAIVQWKDFNEQFWGCLLFVTRFVKNLI